MSCLAHYFIIITIVVDIGIIGDADGGRYIDKDG